MKLPRLLLLLKLKRPIKLRLNTMRSKEHLKPQPEWQSLKKRSLKKQDLLLKEKLLKLKRLN